ncbi:MAG: TIGR03032 family protein [Candidatus Poribacteria bacterium]|nr:TIGR03032 family protein [Candidatus Poribacteria bacterium]
MNNQLSPLSCVYSPNLPELLNYTDCTLIISTYQAGKIIFVSAIDTHNLIQLAVGFHRPMGIAATGDQLAVATRDTVEVLIDSPELSSADPKQFGMHDRLYVPQTTYFSGEINMHDIAWGDDGLWGVNTLFSCLVLANNTLSFEPKWFPSFITDSVGEDRCHINGLALEEGKPRYVTALGESNIEKGWRRDKVSGGILIDVEKDEIVLRNLSMPHSPRIYDDALYFLLASTGELARTTLDAGSFEIIAQLPGFARGMARYQNYLFVGLSRLRKSSPTFADLPIAQRSLFSGFVVLDLQSESIVATFKYENGCEEIYDIQIIPAVHRPGILEKEKETKRPNHLEAYQEYPFLNT